MQIAINKLKEKATKFISFLETQGVNKEEIWISNYNNFKNDITDEAGNTTTNYQVSETIKLKIKDKDKEKLTDKIVFISEEAVKEGFVANSGGMGYCNGSDVEGDRLGLFIEDNNEYIEKLKIEALKDAIKQAKELTSITGLRLGEIFSVSDYTSYPSINCTYLGGASNFLNKVEINGAISVYFEIRR
ncbi:MAG: SIMPL domain-containing protein [bacterium]